jgi:hypothetical protein
MKKILSVAVLAAAVVLAMFLGGCESKFSPIPVQNLPPEVWLSSGPVEGDTTGYQVHFYWGGWDPDGEVKQYEFVVVDGDKTVGYGFNPADTTGLDKWTKTAAHDSTFKVTADDRKRTENLSGATYTRYDRTHTFFVRAIDLQGKRSEPQSRSFTAWTLAPYVNIDQPALPGSGTVATLSRVIKFKWTGRDPIDDPNNIQEPDSIRYLYTQLINNQGQYDASFDAIGDLNANPSRYEKQFSRWIWYRAPEDSGKGTTLGDDELLELNKSYIFAVQAKDEAGAVTAIFNAKSNVRRFIVSASAGPKLTITEPFLGGFVFLGTNMRPISRDLPPGVTLNFHWRGDATSYGGEVASYRYGWDVHDVNNDDDWAVLPSPFNLAVSGVAFYSGTHTLFVEATDNSGTVTLGQVEINIIPFTMDRNILWVDDYYNEAFPDTTGPDYTYASPDLRSYKNFWIGHCKKVAGFDQTRDVYIVMQDYNGKPPEMSLVSRYKNIIWSFSSAPDYMAWDDLVAFTPESQINAGSKLTVNYLSLFLAKGGHLLTEGRADRAGGLAAVLLSNAQVFPIGLKCEITGPKDGCEGDTSGVNTMAYKDYCVSMIDKVSGSIRSASQYPELPKRLVRNFDCMRLGVKAHGDAVTDTVQGMPDTLSLWSNVIAPGKYFNFNMVAPWPGGFTYVEVYDPAYWMNRDFLKSQSCFHPMYRMRAASTASGLDNTVFALWLTKYQNVVPEVQSGVAVAAPSVHFGTELWYFNRTQVSKIIRVIFTKWQILNQ